MNAADKIFNSVKNEVDSISKGQFDLALLVPLFQTTMELAENEQVNGETKQSIVLQIIQRILGELHDRTIIDELLYSNLKTAVNILGPAAIELICLASKGIVKINEKIKECCAEKCNKCNGCNIF